jgi:hypothetical protein
MLQVEIVFGFALALLTVSLIVLFRRERQRRDAGIDSSTHPFFLGAYRGLAVVIVGYVALVVLAAVFRALADPSGP